MASEILNRSGQSNYIAGNKVFILDGINDKTTAELIGNLSVLVDSLDWNPIFDSATAQVINPYSFSAENHPIIDVYINSGGGNLSQTKSIMTLLNLARAKGAIIRTTNMGIAASCASLIAVQGTPKFRIMYEQAYNMIHYGKSTFSVDKVDEIERARKLENEKRANFNAPYLKYTNLTDKELKQFQKTEYGHMNAQKCLQKNICDWILTTDGKFITR